MINTETCKRHSFVHISTLGAAFALLGLLAGCGGPADYSDCFSIQSIFPTADETENRLEVDYEVSNASRKKGLTFCVTLDGETTEYPLEPGDAEEASMIIDIGRPEAYDLSYPVTYGVKKDDETIWTQEETVSYDCTEMFVHPATITYGDSTVSVELQDYQSNYFDLSALFENFDTAAAHNVRFLNGQIYTDAHASVGNDLANIVSSEADTEGGRANAAEGAILQLFTYGSKEANDTYHFSNDLTVQISDAVRAKDVDWGSHMTFSDEANTRSSKVYGMDVTTFEMKVLVENVSDQTIYGKVTKFYVNNSAISDEYLVGSTHDEIKPGETIGVYNISSPPVWTSTGIKNIDKFGLNIQLEDAAGTILYDGIQWLDVK